MEEISESALLSCLLFVGGIVPLNSINEELQKWDPVFKDLPDGEWNLVEIKKKLTGNIISSEKYKKYFIQQGIPESVLPKSLDSFKLFMYAGILSLLQLSNEEFFVSGICLSPENHNNVFGWLKKNKLIINEAGSKLTEFLSFIIGHFCSVLSNEKSQQLLDVQDVKDLLNSNKCNKIFKFKNSLKHSWETDKIIIMETNIDDMTPELISLSMDEVLKIGALDFLVFPVTMKKGRSAVCIQILCAEEKAEEIAEFLFEWTTSFGIRMYPADRWKLKREFVDVETPYGNIKFKKGFIKDQLYKLSPEFEELKKISLDNRQSPITLLNNIYKLTK